VSASAVRAVAMAVPTGVFAWQIFGAAVTFRPLPGHRTSGLAQLISIAFIALLYGGSTASPNIWLVAAAAACSLAALVLFEWARRTVRGQFFSYIFSDDTPAFLCTSGPFAHIRNPFYTSYLMTMTSVAIVRPSLFRGLVVLAMVGYFVGAAVFEERKFARSPMAKDNELYAQRTGRFIPRFL
jgi:protein-S-isoprenylcysteine O-methyltransferase Ste14